MKITRTSDTVNKIKQSERIANKGCGICPCCESPTEKSWIVNQWCTGLFKTKWWQVDKYYCNNCGAEWESEPYEYYYKK